MIDSYLTIKSSSIGEYKDRGSKFMAYAFPITSEENVPMILDDLKAAHPKAVHFCYGYKIGVTGDRFRMNDDGEPSGSAGKPIFGQILSARLTNVIVIVIRYFGGTKLGVPGLIEAYKQAAKTAIDDAVIIEKYIFSQYTITFGYEYMGEIMNVIKDLNIHILSKDFEDKCVVIIEFRQSVELQLLQQLKANIMGRSKDEIGVDFEIPFCNIEKVMV